MNDASALFLECASADTAAVLATVIAGAHRGGKLCLTQSGARAGTLGDDALDAMVFPLLQAALANRTTSRVTLGSSTGEHELFLDVYAPQPRLYIVGAVHSAIVLTTLARAVGFHVTVLDARSAFATPERFAHADQLIVRWPADALVELPLDEGIFLVVLTHDEKIDNPVLALALRSPLRYIGALGSRKTHEKRLAALRSQGIPDELLARIHAPIGLDLGARSPEEIALSILAEIVAVKNGKSG